MIPALHIMAYLLSIGLILIGNFRLFSFIGLLLFGTLLIIQAFKMRKLVYPSTLPVFIAYCAIEISQLFIKDLEIYTGVFFYASFGLIFLISLFLKKPYSYVYATKGSASTLTERQGFHYIITSIWILLFGACILLNTILAPALECIFLPLAICLLGIAILNYLTPYLILGKTINVASVKIEGKEISLDESFEWMVKMFKSELASGWNVNIEYIIKGFGGGKYLITIKDGKCGLQLKGSQKPDLQIITDVGTWFSIVRGELTGEQAFFKKKLKAEGNMELLMLHEEIFDRTKINEEILKMQNEVLVTEPINYPR